MKTQIELMMEWLEPLNLSFDEKENLFRWFTLIAREREAGEPFIFPEPAQPIYTTTVNCPHLSITPSNPDEMPTTTWGEVPEMEWAGTILPSEEPTFDELMDEYNDLSNALFRIRRKLEELTR